MILSRVNATVNIKTHPSIAFSRTNIDIQAGSKKVILIPSYVSLREWDRYKSLSVTSSAPVTIYLVNHSLIFTDMLVTFPLSAVPQEYYVVSIPQRYFGRFKSLFAIAGSAVSHSVVTIIAKVPLTIEGRKFEANSPVTLQLQPMESIKISSEIDDLTGTKIVSDVPVSVYSGHECISRHLCNNMMKQIPAVEYWGKEYIIAPMVGSVYGNLVKILAARNGTLVHANGELYILNEGQSAEIYFYNNNYFSVGSNEPILVSYFSMGSYKESFRYDPIMLLIPAVTQFTNELSIVTPPYDFESYANIIIDSTHKDELMIDGVKLISPWTTITNTNYSSTIIHFRSQQGRHSLKPTSTDIKFGLMLYGYGRHDSYGLPVAMGSTKQFANFKSYLKERCPDLSLKVFKKRIATWFQVIHDFEIISNNLTMPIPQGDTSKMDEVLRYIFTYLDRDKFKGYLDKNELSILFDGLHSYEPCIPRFINSCFEDSQYIMGIELNRWQNCF
ncbi:hypothetical protein LOD99_2297 [Oopsacas minuta]|uniref:IgGFc-binding protein N-terminal domain-containing protein n=1 Tax=Oopsacas minuta TaxID=111878 RepID=A0AAV7K1E0_9METZ|nr:hypothetical protein LOD99_2297 [Oopsacas minuta]